MKNLFFLLLFFYFPILANHTVLLKNGEVIKGSVVSQDADGLTVESSEGMKKVIGKNNILRVIYRDIPEEEEEKIRKLEEDKLLAKQKEEEEENRKKSEEQKRIQEEKKIQLLEKKEELDKQRSKNIEKRKKEMELLRKKSQEASKPYNQKNLTILTSFQLNEIIPNQKINTSQS